MLRIGLTGGIGSGKSTVAALFAEHGVPIVDADEIARNLVAPGLPAYEEIVRVLGRSLLLPDGSLDRTAVRRLVFADTAKRKQLEAILHPRVRTALEEWVRATRAAYGVLVIPLLIENGLFELVDRVLVVDCEEAAQVARVSVRSGLSEAEVKSIMTAQANRQERLRHADDVIENNNGVEHLAREVARLHAYYLTLAPAFT
jgi:dephospho-CoA kinase